MPCVAASDVHKRLILWVHGVFADRTFISMGSRPGLAFAIVKMNNLLGLDGSVAVRHWPSRIQEVQRDFFD